MYKKLITACIAVAAFAAFVVPATASAVPPELEEAGVKVPVGSEITATNAGTTVFSGSFGKLVCAKTRLHGKVTKNNGNGEPIEGTIETASVTGTEAEPASTHCASPFGPFTVTTAPVGGNGTPWCMKALPGSAHELQIRGNSCDNPTRSITYEIHFTSAGYSCKYERTALTGPVKGTYTTTGAETPAGHGSHLTIKSGVNSEFKIQSGQSVFCPASVSWEMTFELETKNGTKIGIV